MHPFQKPGLAYSACKEILKMSTLDIQREGAVARVFLNRPEVRNAFNDETIAELTMAFAALGKEAGLKAIVLGAHGKAFSAGADEERLRESIRLAVRRCATLWTGKKPLVEVMILQVA